MADTTTQAEIRAGAMWDRFITQMKKRDGMAYQILIDSAAAFRRLFIAANASGEASNAPTGDERLRQLAANRCVRQAWPDSGQEWTFNEAALMEFARAVLADAAGGRTGTNEPA